MVEVEVEVDLLGCQLTRRRDGRERGDRGTSVWLSRRGVKERRGRETMIIWE
jgi:hypothetical protein